jgi:hypothetical protein
MPIFTGDKIDIGESSSRFLTLRGASVRILTKLSSYLLQATGG